MLKGVTGIAEHAASGPGLMRDSPIGRIAITLAFFCVFRVALDIAGIAHPLYWAVAATVFCEASLFVVRRKLRHKQQAREFADIQNQERDRKSEFDKRYEDAKRSGAFDRFGKEGEK